MNKSPLMRFMDRQGNSLARVLSRNFALFSLFLVVALTIVFLFQFTRDKLKENAEKNLLLARAVSGQVEVVLKEPVTVLRNIRNMLSHRTHLKNLEVADILLNHVVHSTLFDSIYLLDSNGLVTAVGLKLGSEGAKEDYIGLNMSHKRFFQNARKSTGPNWSDTFLSLISGKMSLALSLAVEDKVLVGNINLQILSSIINKINLEEDVLITIVDHRSTIVAQSGKADVGHQIKVNHIELFRRGLSGKENTLPYTFEGVRYLGSVTGIEGPGWVAAVSQRFKVIYQPIIRIGLYTIAFAVAIVILAIIFGTFLSRKISHPLVTLTNTARSIADGHYDLKWKHQGYKEVDELSRSFQKMIHSIQDREDRLRLSRKRYQTLFERANDAIFIIHKQTGRYLNANNAAEQLTGRTITELKQLTTRDITPDGADERLITSTVSNSVTEFGQVKYYRPDGTFRITKLNAVPLDSETMIGIARDITEELAIEEKLRQSEKMEAIGTLAGGIAHDFNNILTAILGYSELALIELDDTSPTKSKLEVIQSSGQRAKDLVAQILAFSRKDEQVWTPVNVNAIIEDAMKLLRPAIPMSIKITTDIKESCVVLGNPSRIHQIVMNLCTNGYQAMQKEGGILRVALANIDIEIEEANKHDIQAGEYIELCVSDTGTGISQKNQSRIFEPYFTTKESGKGTGLGLASTHGIIKSHNGAISVQSELGQGSVFTVYLPRVREEGRPVDPSKTMAEGGDESILLVDDESVILEFEKITLESMGYTVTVADNSFKALEIFQMRPNDFQLVITDMTMPEMNGEQLSIEIQRIQPGLPIILCTGYSELISRDKALAIGISSFLMKPISRNALLKTIREVLTLS